MRQRIEPISINYRLIMRTLPGATRLVQFGVNTTTESRLLYLS